AIDASAARAMPGVIDVIVDDPRLPQQAAGFGPPPSGHATIDHYDQLLGIVVAESFEAARAAARAVRATIEAEPGRYGYDMMAGLDEASGPPRDSRL
ncbi:hypothetical protein AAC908_18385, partial [Elizabethkingia meningoseptica]